MKKNGLKNKKDILIRTEDPKFAQILEEGISAFGMVRLSAKKAIQSLNA